MGLVLLLFAAGGLLGGLLWRWLWTPFTGTVLEGVWYPDVNHSDFAGTGLYVLIGLGLGVVLGAVSAVLSDRRELTSLVLVVVAAVLAAGLMMLVGEWGMPADPHELARSSADRARLPASLGVEGWTPLAALPVGALVGLFGVFIGVTRNPGDSVPTEQHDS